jgi:hypothetical protein
MLTGCDRIRIEARFLRHTKRLPSGCLIWTGAQSSGGPGAKFKNRGGPYGSFKVSAAEGTRRAHIVWAWLRGRIPTLRVPKGHHLDHTCHSSTLCVECTELVTDTVNLKRNWSEGNARHSANPKDRSTASAVLQEVHLERRARMVRAKRRRARKARQVAPGNPASKAAQSR